MTQIKITFLGTSGSMPTPERGSSSQVIRFGRELLMFDCGEGTQRQMVKAHIGFQRHMMIFISHMHGDHVLGIPGMLQSMSLIGREKPLYIYGPEGLVEYIKAFSDSLGGPSFPVILYEINEPGIVRETEEYRVEAIRAIHRETAWSYGLFEFPRPGRFYPEKAVKLDIPKGKLWGRLHHGEIIELNGRKVYPDQVRGPERPGRTIIYSGDTAPNEKLIELSKDADLLIHEATFLDELAGRAAEDGHTTAFQAAQIAKEADVKLLVLTHISPRYPESEILRLEAENLFKDVLVAEDLLELELPLK